MASFQVRDSRKQSAGQSALIERRSRVRFPFELRVQFRSLEPGYRLWGTGQLINMSSGGLLVSSEHQMIIGTPVELNIDWPTRLDGRLPLQLIAAGTVTRCDPFRFAIVLERHHFRLAGGAAGKRREDQTPAAC